MKRLGKKIILISIIFGIVFIPIGTVKATLQANPNTNAKKGDTVTSWMTNVRNMEKSGEAMGLSEKLNDDLTPSTDSNGIDMHLMRSTEYGAIAILSASGYGNPKILQESTIKTSTGNKTGVYFPEVEGVAGGLKEGFTGIDSRYYDLYIYRDSSSAKSGDALGKVTDINPGCLGWHSAGYDNMWENLGTHNYVYVFRGLNGIFSNTVWTNTGGGQKGVSHGVASCGEGL